MCDTRPSCIRWAVHLTCEVGPHPSGSKATAEFPDRTAIWQGRCRSRFFASAIRASEPARIPDVPAGIRPRGDTCAWIIGTPDFRSTTIGSRVRRPFNAEFSQTTPKRFRIEAELPGGPSNAINSPSSLFEDRDNMISFNVNEICTSGGGTRRGLKGGSAQQLRRRKKPFVHFNDPGRGKDRGSFDDTL
jgi:hypothetical protein